MQRFLSLGVLFLWPLLTALTATPALPRNQPRTTAAKAPAEPPAGIQEEWLSVYQDEEKVGYLQRLLVPVKNGYSWEEHWWLSLRLTTETYVTHTEVRARANRSCALTSFSLWSSGGGTALYIKANITNQGSSRQKIKGESISNGKRESFTLSLALPLHLPPLCQMAIPIDQRPGTNRDFSVFNPISLQTEKVRLTTLGVETIELNGQRQVATKLASLMGDTTFYMWLDQEGRTLREEIAPGVILQKESQELATTDSWKERGMIFPTSRVDFLKASGEE